MLDRSTVIKLNEDELLPVVEIEDPGEAAGRLLDRGASLALVSMGPEGSVLRHSDVPGRGTVIRIERVVDAPARGTHSLRAR
jgi:sugar/nucleoside kinase (ribokinase family)